MSSDWNVYLTDHNGVRLADMTDNHGFQFIRVANSVGAFRLNLPATFDDTLLAPSNRVEVWRTFAGDARLLFTGLVDRWQLEGQNDLNVDGKCINHLLDRRVIIREYEGLKIDAIIAVGKDSSNNATFYRSLDLGLTWTKTQTTAGSGDSGKACSGTSTVSHAVACVHTTGAEEFWKSTDSGASWTQKDTGGTSCNTKDIVLADNGNLIIGHDDDLWLSTDGGDNWSLTDTVTGSSVNAICRDSDGNIYAVESDWPVAYSYKSTDNGVNFTKTGATGDSCAVIAEASNGDIFVAHAPSGPASKYSTDDTATWNGGSYLGLNKVPVHGIGLAGVATCFIALSNTDALYRSTDYGHTFSFYSNQGIDHMQEITPGVIVAASSGANIIYSNDSGATWSVKYTEPGVGAEISAVAVLYA